MTSTLSKSPSPERLTRLSEVIQSRIDARHIPGAVMLIEHDGKVVLERALGLRDPASDAPMEMDTIFRIYSMTKPVVSVAIMMLVEAGQLLISDPVSKYLPELTGMQVGVEETAEDGSKRLKLVPAAREMTVQDLLRHTSGLTYGIFGESLVKTLYLEKRIERIHTTNADLIRELATVPLAYQPGTLWEYSRSTDVLGGLVERISGASLDVWLDQHILKPLGMKDSGFWVPPAQQHRIAEPFPVDPDRGGKVKLTDIHAKPSFLSGGGGMVSTAHDYLRFTRMLHNDGTLDGVRILSRKTLEYMRSDHLADMPEASRTAGFLPGPGYGFGLGFAVRRTPGAAWTPGSPGDYHWSGLAGTYFWIDPAEKLIAIFLMQAPEQRGEYRQLFRNLVYAAL
ncbi:MAG: beta-lactamase family protein [Herminiimonas sp.]|nr:beta-lactamase family protein [Herminiimonas sp.]MDB5855467.1 beta-lactamase family protein [Herminiimonas sp.]